ncbi:MAG: hypothetical protein ACOCX5_05205 [Chloroflexota bacterium]
MRSDIYHAFTDQLTANLQSDNRVQGLVLLGSTAHQNRSPDEWSDHDFFIITASGAQEDFRTNFDWLPDHDEIVLTIRETEHGLKILYASGHLLEYAVFDLAEIALAKANDYRVAFDRGGAEAAMQAIATLPTVDTYTSANLARDMGMFLCLLVVGAGRVTRGEAISGQVFIRAYAVGHLLSALVHGLQTSEAAQLDNLDPYRRFERVFPQIGAEINTALNHDPISAALDLLDVYERHLCESEAYSEDASSTVRAFFARL